MPDHWTIVSDLHLGGGLTRTDELLAFVRSLSDCTLVLNGDTVDANAGLVFPDAEVEIIEAIQDARRRGVKVIRLPGNHDARPWPLFGIIPADEEADCLTIRSGGKTFYIAHGHAYDTDLLAHPEVTAGVIWWERWLAHLWPQAARWAKETLKVDRGLPDVVRAGALASRRSLGVDAVIAGHTHVPEVTYGPCQLGLPWYVNLGCFCGTVAPTYATIEDGTLTLRTWGQ